MLKLFKSLFIKTKTTKVDPFWIAPTGMLSIVVNQIKLNPQYTSRPGRRSLGVSYQVLNFGDLEVNIQNGCCVGSIYSNNSLIILGTEEKEELFSYLKTLPRAS